ncbi:MAG: ATP-binding cassette domain-containing protein [Acidimicrobiia bacterium]|nr:ATP-binding cassette domain-containing protein [Acidimicrobiia bacterium]
MTPALELQDVRAARGGTDIWSEGTFAIPTGSIVAAIGPNGSGKTTLLQMILGLIPPAAGTLRVMGEAPGRGNPRIGYVPQGYAAEVGEAIRCRDLVALGRTGTRWGLGRRSSDDRNRVDAALASVSALDLADRRLSQLSGGQQQRIAIAQALVGDPDLLLLDEPLANLDIHHQQEIVGLLRELHRARPITMLIVVHDLNPLLSILDGAIYLLDGHAHYGAIGDVVDSELLTHLYDAPIKVVRTVQGDLFTSGEFE